MLKGKTAVVTGGARGIGKAICAAMAKSGANIAFLYNGSEEKSGQTLGELEQYGITAKKYKCDISDYNACEQICKQIINDFGKVDILVNNAGITNDKLILQMNEADFGGVVDINLKGTFNMIKHFCRHFVKNKYGKIINISSVSGITGNAGQANYSSSKAGVIGLTKTVAKELASKNVCCNAIAPGFILTDMTEKFADNEAVISSIPLKKIGNAEDVANLAVFLASNLSDYITGDCIRVDGGLAM